MYLFVFHFYGKLVFKAVFFFITLLTGQLSGPNLTVV